MIQSTLMPVSSNESRGVAKHATTAITDFDLHGLVGIRVEGGSARDVKAIGRQLGLAPTTLQRQPDMVVRVHSADWCPGPMRLLGRDDAGFNESGFYLLHSKQKSSCCVRVPLADLGRPIEEGPLVLDCRTGFEAVPMLIALVNATVVARGYLPLHAAAFRYQDRAIVVTGWSKGGKTESLLGFMARGAEYLGDEWVYLSPDGNAMWGIPEPITVWDWHLQQLPHLRQRAGWKRRTALSTWTLINRLALAARHGLQQVGLHSPAKLLRRLQPMIEKQRHLNLPPELAFPHALSRGPAHPDALFFVVNHDSQEITVSPIDAEEVAERMTYSLVEERMDLLSLYQHYRFAFPDQGNSLLDDWEAVQRQLLHRVFASLPSWCVAHPYPVSISAMTDRMADVLAPSSREVLR